MQPKLWKRVGSAVLLCALAAQLCCPAFADDGDTIYLNDADDLVAFAGNCAYDAWSRGKTVILQRDISLGGVEFRPAANFGGTFEGGGHTVSGLNVSGSVSPAGLFGTVADTGVVRDLNVEGSVAPGGSGDIAGGVAGVNRGTISGCSFAGTVEGEKRVGGVVGENMANGAVNRCTVTGGVFGKNMTGGVVGANHGAVFSCTNRAYVNTNTLDPSISFDQMDFSLAGLSSLMSPDTFNVTVDSGGVAGFSDGTLMGCRNYGSVGYQHVGYNVGGVAGRSSGYVSACANDGRVYGRREVGGVVGMAEPYVKLDLRESSVEEVRRQLNALSATVSKTVDDAEGGSATISARLTAINGSVDEANTRAQTLTDHLADYYDGTVTEIDRGSAILGNAIDRLDTVTRDMVAVSEDLTASAGYVRDALNTMIAGKAFENLSLAAGNMGKANNLIRDDRGLPQINSGVELLEEIQSGDAPTSELRTAYGMVHRGFNFIMYGRETKPDGDEVEGVDYAGAPYYMDQALTEFNAAMVVIGGTMPTLKTAMDYLYTASGEMTTALRDTESLLRYLDAQENLHFDQLGPEADAEADALYDSLRGISNNLELLNQETKSAADVVLEDVRQINRQFTALMNTLLDVVEDVEGMSPTAVVEDTSDEDIDGVLNGKVLLSSNSGEVSGDIDVGGVAGSMMIYNELDPENDNEDLSSTFHKRYELKCILQECVNSGAVTGKRDNVGAVCGSATLGVISGCEGYGSAESESGDYVGGIAGYADNIVRKCWAKCALAGAKYVGGIVGCGDRESSSLRVEGCRSLVEVTRSEQYAGAVAGFETGAYSNNRFVSGALAGIDRVSYREKAEPVSYEELLEEGGVPQEFRRFTLAFVADGSTIRTVRFAYGDSLGDDAFPEIPEREGQFARWDRGDLRDLRFDTTVTAIYTPCLTALASGITRSAARPAFFVEGTFDDAASFDASPAILDFNGEQEAPWRVLRAYRRAIEEQWELTLPDDGALTHVVRYLPPEGVSDRLEIYASGGDGWTRLETGKMGSYLTFDTNERSLALTVVSTATPWWVNALVIGFLIAAAALLAVLLIRKRRKPAAAGEDKAALALRKKKRVRLRVILLAAALVLGAAVGAAIRFAPRITDSMGLYMLLRNYSERSDLDMALSLRAQLDGEALDTDVRLYTADCGGKRVSCVMWQDIPIYFCDGVMLLENGKAYRADGVLADYSQMLTHAAGLYRALEVTVTEENAVKTYHASVEGEEAERLLATLLPDAAERLTDTQAVDLDLIVTDGELTSLRVEWAGDASSMTAELSTLESAEHVLPAAVRGAVASGEYADAEEIGPALKRLVLAWTELASRDPLTADVTLAANCGPLLLDETLTWQRTRAYEQELSHVSRRGMSLWFTDDAACTGGGLKVGAVDATYSAAAELVRLAYQAFLLGEADCTEFTGGWRYSVTLNADEMADFAAAIAPETRSLGVTPTDGTVRLELRDDAISSLVVQCKGAMRVVRTDVPAAVSARLTFDRDAALDKPPETVVSALGLNG